MKVTPETVAAEKHRLHRNANQYVKLINDCRAHLGDLFETDVGKTTVDAFREEVDIVFANGDRAANLTGFIQLLRLVDVSADYPGYVVDEILGREIAATIVDTQPERLLAEATFHVFDVQHNPATASAGEDDLDAAIAAGFQTRMEGWPWRATPSPFSP